MKIEDIVDNHFNDMLDEILDLHDDDLFELVVEIQTEVGGKTVRRSWLDRNKRLRENE